MAGEDLEVRLTLVAGGLDEDSLAECATALGDELAELDVEAVEPAAAGDAPEGAKGVELLAVGALVVKLASSAKVLRQVLDTVRDWVQRNDAEKVRLEIGGDVIEVEGASPEERRALVDAWLLRHAPA